MSVSWTGFLSILNQFRSSHNLKKFSHRQLGRQCAKRMTKRQQLWRFKRFILHFLKAYDFNISDIAIHEEEVSIAPEMELVIKKLFKFEVTTQGPLT